MESPNLQGMPATQPKKSNTGLIIAIVVAVLLCCCCIAVLAGVFYIKTKATSAINEQLTAMPDIMTSMPGLMTSIPDLMTSVPGMMTSIPALMTSMPSGTSSPDATPGPSDLGIPADAVPQGGLGDDIQRAQAWVTSLATVIMSGCMAPVAKDTSIEVTQKPDANGVWKERWTIACDGSDSVLVDITFKPSDSGVTDISVTQAK